MLVSAPLVAMSAGAIVLLLFDVFMPKGWSPSFVGGLFLMLAFVILCLNIGEIEAGRTIFAGALYADPLSFFTGAFLIVAGVIALMIAASRPREQFLEQSAEWHSLLLLTMTGAYVFASAANLLVFFLGLELMSLGLYCLCASARRERNSIEAALKYFILGSFSSAFLLFGISLLYGLTGSFSLSEISSSLGQMEDVSVMYAALFLSAAGVLFKMGAVPFHFWVPDVYEGAPAPVTGFMASVIKGLSVIAAIRIFYEAFGNLQSYWIPVLWTVAVLTIVAGNLIALRQDNVKRMLAYSSIAHAGYILTGFLVLSRGDEYGAGAGVLYYLVAYGIASLGAFGIVHALGGRGDAAGFAGLSKSDPMSAFMMLLFLLSLAGLPPGMAGLLSKVYVFYSVVQGGYIGLVIIAVLGSAVSLYYYLRVAAFMYFYPPAGEADAGNQSPLLRVALIICAAFVVFTGVFPSGVYSLAADVCRSL